MNDNNNHQSKKPEITNIPSSDLAKAPSDLLAAKVAVNKLLECGLKVDECFDKVTAIEEKDAKDSGSYWKTLFNTNAKIERVSNMKKAAHQELREFVFRYKYGEDQVKQLAKKLTAQGYQLPKLDLQWQKYRLSPALIGDPITGGVTVVVPIMMDLPYFSVALPSAQKYRNALDKIISHEISQTRRDMESQENNHTISAKTKKTRKNKKIVRKDHGYPEPEIY